MLATPLMLGGLSTVENILTLIDRKGVSGAIRLLVCRLPDRSRAGLLCSLQRGMMLVRKRFEIDEKSLGWLRDTCQGVKPGSLAGLNGTA